MAAATTTSAADTHAARVRELLSAAVTDIAQNQWGLPPPEEVIVLYSGGVDSSVSLHLARTLLGVTHAITVLVQDADAADAPWAEAVEDEGVSHTILRPTLAALLADDMPFLVETIQSFDGMALRNSVCATHALKYAAKLGFKYVLTGDAADELMGGYSFTHRHQGEDWLKQRAVMVAKMHFDSVVVGKALGMQVTSPFLHPSFVDYCLSSLTRDDCIGPWRLRATPTAPLDEAPTTTGKIPLRGAFPELLSSSRRKDPQEIGCGTTLLGAASWAKPPRLGYFDTRIEDDEWAKQKARVQETYGIALRDKEHLAYFLLFEKIYGGGKDGEGALTVPGKPRPNDDPCPACGFKLDTPTQTFCLTCGHYDEALARRHAGNAERK